MQRTVLAHSQQLAGLIRHKLTRIILCPNNSPVPSYIKYRETAECHTKFIISHKEKDTRFYLTSMNLEVGLWENFLFEVTDKNQQHQMLTHFNTKWESADDPTPLPTFDHLIK